MSWTSSSEATMAGAPLKTLAALLLVALLGIAAAWRITGGFQVVTTEDARRLSIREHSRQLPDATIEYETGLSLPLAQALREDGRATIAVFFYTRCTSVCSVMGSEFQQLQDTIRARGLASKVRMLSISFDASDGQTELAAYAKRMHAQSGWRFAHVPDAGQRHSLLDAFGITVIPAPLGEFQHNAAFHILSPDGRLVRIVDYDQPEAALAHAMAVAQKRAPS